jgi:hypothetical protein
MRASSISEMAYLASRWESGVLFDSTEELSSFVNSLREQKVDINEEDLKDTPSKRKMQKDLTDQISKAKYTEVVRELDEDGKARISACCETGANDWLQALPTAPHKRYSDRQWKILVRLRLGCVCIYST